MASHLARSFYLWLGMLAFWVWCLNPAEAQTDTFVVEPVTVGLPLANQTQDGVGCKSSADLLDPVAKSYAELLADRFNTDVTICLTDTPEEVVALAQEGEVNFAWVTKEAAAPILGDWRPALTLRYENGLGRVPFVMFALRSGQSVDDLSELQASDIGVIDRPPQSLHINLAKRVLKDFNILKDDGVEPLPYQTHEALFEAVENGQIPAGILEAGTWGRVCAVLDPDATFCDHFEVMLYDRQRADIGFILPTDTDRERFYRLIGVHIALHLDLPAAHDWLRQGKGLEFEPTEASAMDEKSTDRAIAF